MAVKILEVKRESFLATRFIGKRYEHGPNWGEWWQNDWLFDAQMFFYKSPFPPSISPSLPLK